MSTLSYFDFKERFKSTPTAEFDRRPSFDLGDRATDANGRVYVFCEAGAAIDASDVVVVRGDHQIFSGATTTAPGQALGVISDDAFANDEQGWVCIAGTVNGNAAAGTTHEVELSMSGTAGHVTSTVNKDRVIVGMRRAHSATANLAAAGPTPLNLNYPTIVDVQ